jgi:hypothetical protein
MNSEALQNLPIEMQQRLAQIMAQGQATGNVDLQAPAFHPQPGLKNPGALAPRPPSLMDHLIELRGEVAEMRNEVGQMRQEMAQLAQIIQANSGVVEGVGQAVGTIYQMFQQTSNPSTTYSQSFTEAPASSEDY